jgi:NAD(P)-dependent dehydrogenase (short-subunit alcohol dehydrogenase family)
VDYLINAAGYILDAAVEEATPEEVQRQFNTNVFGTTNTIRAFLPLMRKQELAPSGTRGTVVTFGSLGSWTGGATYAFYSMTKWCMSGLAESLQPELSPFKIRATVIEPGYFRTGFLNAGAKVTSALRIPEYEDESTATGQVRRALVKFDGNQLGDVKKGAAVCVDMLTGTGVAEGKELPVRIVLGSDCEQTIRSKCASTMELLDEWAPVIRSTDHQS